MSPLSTDLDQTFVNNRSVKLKFDPEKLEKVFC